MENLRKRLPNNLNKENENTANYAIHYYIIEYSYHFLPQTLRLQHENIPTMPQQSLLGNTTGANC